MTEKVVLVTPPDDVLQDGIRVLLVDLTQDQTSILSDALKQLPPDYHTTGVIYVWNSWSDTNTDWLIEKKQKSNVIVFNAESDNQLIVGYMAAQPNAYYFGTLKSLHSANSYAIYNTDQVIQLLETTLAKNEIR
jgi:hypothetical protein